MLLLPSGLLYFPSLLNLLGRMIVAFAIIFVQLAQSNYSVPVLLDKGMLEQLLILGPLLAILNQTARDETSKFWTKINIFRQLRGLTLHHSGANLKISGTLGIWRMAQGELI